MDIINKIQYKVQQIGYNKTIQELLNNLKNAIKKGIGVLEEIRLGSINKEGLLKKELFPSLIKENLFFYY